MLAMTMFHRFENRLAAKDIHPKIRGTFARWLKEHNKTFNSPAEYFHRLAIFATTHSKIETHNSQESTYRLGHNAFSHMTEEEFVVKHTGLNLPEDYERNIVLENLADPPTTMDWRTKGAVNPVKNQASCGSCWAFSATAAVEGAWQISGHKLENLSEQQLVDCSRAQGNQGCNGGWMDYAFKYLIAVGGQERTSDYPYKAVDGTCQFSAAKIAASIKNFKDVNKNDCKTLLAFAAQGPTSVAIAANAIMQYKDGVFSNAQCGTGLNHGVTLVGYDISVSTPYYIVRNSWGATWGEQGYIRMATNVMTSTGICGICQASSMPTN
jgi:C1A family cysteine protease